MKRRALTAVFTSLVLITFWFSSGEADQVQLTNGDRITGEVVRMERGVLFIKTSYAGEIQIKWEEVACIVSEEDLKMVLKSNEVLIGRATCPSSGKVRIVSKRAGESAPLSPAAFEAINPSPPPPAITYKGNITAGGSRTDGNTDTAAFNTSARFQARSDRHRFTLAGKYNYAEDDSEVNTRNALASFKYDFFVTERVFSYAQSLVEYDEFEDLNLRSTLGLGLGYQFLETDRTNLFAEAGISYFNEDYEVGEDDSYSAARWSVGFDHELVPERLKVFHLHEGYYSLEEGSYYIRSEQGLRFPLVRHFFANFQVDHKYNSDPAPGREKSDTAYIFGLGYEYEF
jgi:putative salt-induced outer membrane protein YdiY